MVYGILYLSIVEQENGEHKSCFHKIGCSLTTSFNSFELVSRITIIGIVGRFVLKTPIARIHVMAGVKNKFQSQNQIKININLLTFLKTFYVPAGILKTVAC